MVILLYTAFQQDLSPLGGSFTLPGWWFYFSQYIRGMLLAWPGSTFSVDRFDSTLARQIYTARFNCNWWDIIALLLRQSFSSSLVPQLELDPLDGVAFETIFLLIYEIQFQITTCSPASAGPPRWWDGRRLHIHQSKLPNSSTRWESEHWCLNTWFSFFHPIYHWNLLKKCQNPFGQGFQPTTRSCYKDHQRGTRTSCR